MKIFLLLFLFGCNSLTTIQCSPKFEYVEIEGKKYIDAEKSKCRCRGYKFDKEYVGPTNSDKTIEEINQCNLMVGFKSKHYGDVSDFWEYVRKKINDKSKLK